MKANSRKIKLLHVTSTPSGIGGIEKLLLLISEKYDKASFELYFCNLFSKSDDEIYLSGLKQRGFKPFSLKGNSSRKALLFIPALSAYIKNNKIDIVHTWLFHSNLIGQIAALPNPCIRVLSRQYKDYFFIYKNILKQKIDMVSHRIAHKIVACSEEIKRHLVEVEKIPKEKIEVIYNSVDLNRMCSCAENKKKIIHEFGLEGKKCIGVVANLHPRKGHEYLFVAVSLLKLRIPNIKVLCIGEGPYRKHLQEEADRLNILGNVIFTGYREDIPDLISAMDIVVQPSIEEGFGISLIEAMSMNKPIVASLVGGIPEVIGNYVGGVLVKPKDADALYQEIYGILSNQNFSLNIANKGREVVEARFGAEQMIRSYEALYLDLIKNK
ncbi:MAG: glycosyltransferase [Candidatus Omnitrophica bacterium]|nr:glycosyltransferase [Candidatus Omnitrophota bacterium]